MWQISHFTKKIMPSAVWIYKDSHYQHVYGDCTLTLLQYEEVPLLLTPQHCFPSAKGHSLPNVLHSTSACCLFNLLVKPSLQVPPFVRVKGLLGFGSMADRFMSSMSLCSCSAPMDLWHAMRHAEATTAEGTSLRDIIHRFLAVGIFARAIWQWQFGQHGIQIVPITQHRWLRWAILLLWLGWWFLLGALGACARVWGWVGAKPRAPGLVSDEVGQQHMLLTKFANLLTNSNLCLTYAWNGSHVGLLLCFHAVCMILSYWPY